METATDKHIILLIFLALGFLIVSGISQQFGSYAFICAVLIFLFVAYLKIIMVSPDFIQKDYDVMLGDKIFFENYTQYDGKKREIYLTGEDKFPYKKIADCKGIGAYNLDTFPEVYEIKADKKTGENVKTPVFDVKKMKSKKVLIFWYMVYSRHFIIRFFQSVIPKIPIVDDILRSIPFVRNFCFPTARAIICPEDIVSFKPEVIEIRGLSLMPLSVKENFNSFSIVEYSGKFNEMRDFERFIFDKSLASYGYQEILNTALNTANASAKLNPKVKIEQEQSIIKSR